jgi:hypothetical protein
MAVDSIFDDIVSRLDAKKTSAGYTAKCPAHDDNRASLSIAQGADGRILFRCHAGCDFGAITSSLGLNPADCFAADETRPAPRPVAKIPFPYPTLKKAIDCGLKSGTTSTKVWEYHDENGQTVGAVVRYDGAAGKKTYRPFSLVDGGWYMAAMPAPRPLYGLPAVVKSDAKILVIVEGEKCVDAAVKLGFTATTSAGGANAAGHTDWKPASAFDQVWIIPDADEPGLAYADEVERQIKSHDPACQVKVIGLPDVGIGGDIVDWIANQSSHDPAILRESISRLAGASAVAVGRVDEPNHEADGIPWKPFPVHLLPPVMRRFVDDGASSIGCDSSYLSLPILTTAGAAIGATRVVELKPGWTAPPILWTAVIGSSSAAKSPAFAACHKLLSDPQRRWHEDYTAAKDRHNAAAMAHEKALKLWMKNEAGDPPSPPVKPSWRRFVIDDATAQSVAGILANNPRGLVLLRDELAGFFASFTRFSSTSDAPLWLPWYNGASQTVDRRGRDEPLFLPRPLVAISGCIPPAILRRHLAGDNSENGIASRFLFAAPPETDRRWRDEILTAGASAAMAEVMTRLLAIQIRQDGLPETLVLSDEAEDRFKAWVNENGAAVKAADDEATKSALGKIEEVPGRLSIILHHMSKGADEMAVSGETMANAIELAQWFRNEARRWYAASHESPAETNGRKLVELIRKAGTITARDAQRRCRWLKGSGMAEKALEQLRRDGLLDHEVITRPEGGRPATVYRLRGSVDTAARPG